MEGTVTKVGDCCVYIGPSLPPTAKHLWGGGEGVPVIRFYSPFLVNIKVCLFV